MSVRPCLSPPEVADYLDCSVKTLRNWRAERGGPPYIKVGNKVLYPVHLFEKWVEGKVVYPKIS